MKPHLTIQSLSTPMLANEKNIDFDGELSVEANAIWAQYKTCEY